MCNWDCGGCGCCREGLPLLPDRLPRCLRFDDDATDASAGARARLVAPPPDADPRLVCRCSDGGSGAVADEGEPISRKNDGSSDAVEKSAAKASSSSSSR